MFETVSRSRRRRPAAGVGVSILLHVAVIGAVLWLTRVHRPPRIVVEDQPILRPPPAGKSKPVGTTTPGPRHPATPHKHATLVQPVAPPAAVDVKPPVEDVQNDEPDRPELGFEDDAGEYPGEATGSPNGVPGFYDSVSRGPLPFDGGRMTPPRLVAGPNPQYTREALEHEIEGTMDVQCIVTEQGIVHGCRVITGLPFLNAPVVRALEQRRYAPAILAGRPVEVDYVFRVQMKLPN